MGRTIIKPLHDFELSSIKQLSDRSDLARLYFKPTNNCYAGAIPLIKKQMTKAEFKKIIEKTSTIVGLLMAIPFIVGELLILFIATLSSGQVSLYILFPIALSSLLFIWLVSYTYSRATDRLSEVGVSTNFIILYTWFCISLTIWPAYKFMQTYSSPLTQLTIYCLAIAAISLISCRLLLGLVDDNSTSYRIKMFIICAPLCFCVAINLISIYLSVMV
jgi:hypothetical protein